MENDCRVERRSVIILKIPYHVRDEEVTFEPTPLLGKPESEAAMSRLAVKGVDDKAFREGVHVDQMVHIVPLHTA